MQVVAVRCRFIGKGRTIAGSGDLRVEIESPYCAVFQIDSGHGCPGTGHEHAARGDFRSVCDSLEILITAGKNAGVADRAAGTYEHGSARGDLGSVCGSAGVDVYDAAFRDPVA